MSEQKFPLGWDAERTKRIADHYDGMSDNELTAEDEAATREQTGRTTITVPDELLPAIRQLLANHRAK
jgi:hypothetical protein